MEDLFGARLGCLELGIGWANGMSRKGALVDHFIEVGFEGKKVGD